MELYVHIPFCLRKCKYCDFLSWDNKIDCVRDYIDSLILDIKNEASNCSDVIETIYIGGGTPGLLNESYIEAIVNAIKENFALSTDVEFTIETNPCAVLKSKAQKYISLGINRVSMGVQSFDDNELQLLGRAHDSKTIYKSFSILREAGFKNISIDLIQSLPGQTVEGFINNLNKAIELNPEHISAYELIIEPGTKFYELYGPDSDYEEDLDTSADIYERSVDLLAKHDYKQYEISNFSKKGYESKHNSGYWKGKPYIGCGAGAVGYINNIRKKKSTDLHSYINNPLEYTEEIISLEDKKKEFVFLGMRMAEGIDINTYEKRFGEKFPQEYTDIFNKYGADYIIHENNKFKFTTKGFLVSNIILSDFM